MKFSKKNLLLSVIIIIIIIVATLFACLKLVANNNKKEKYSLEKGYLIAESQDYKIFYSGLKDGDLVTVVEKSTNSILVSDPTCEIDIPENNTDFKEFYNKSVGIIKLSPYKTVSFKAGTKNTFEQTVLNGGCVSKEGEITLSKSDDDKKVKCEIKIQYEFLGC